MTEEKETGMRKRTEMKREISTLGMRANKRMWPVFLMTPLFKKKKKTLKEQTFLLVLVIVRPLCSSSPIKIGINHCEQARNLTWLIGAVFDKAVTQN